MTRPPIGRELTRGRSYYADPMLSTWLADVMGLRVGDFVRENPRLAEDVRSRMLGEPPRFCVQYRQRRRVRFTTGVALVNELGEAKQQLQLRRVLARWAHYDVIAIDEVGYLPLAELGAEFLFQVISNRAEQAAVLLITNLPFSEWTQVIPNARLCKALLDRITDRAHINGRAIARL